MPGERLEQAAEQTRDEIAAERAAFRTLPAMPAKCSTPILINLKEGERLDVLTGRLLLALQRSNTEKLACHMWYSRLVKAYGAYKNADQ